MKRRGDFPPMMSLWKIRGVHRCVTSSVMDEGWWKPTAGRAGWLKSHRYYQGKGYIEQLAIHQAFWGCVIYGDWKCGAWIHDTPYWFTVLFSLLRTCIRIASSPPSSHVGWQPMSTGSLLPSVVIPSHAESHRLIDLSAAAATAFFSPYTLKCNPVACWTQLVLERGMLILVYCACIF